MELKNVPKSYTLVQTKGKNLQKRREDQEFLLWVVQGQTWQQALLHLCVCEAAEAMSWMQEQARALKFHL